MTERSWRDSKISALDNVITEEHEKGTDGEEVQRESVKGLRISSPVPGSFEHVDGAFIGKEVKFTDIDENRRRGSSGVVGRAI